MGEVGGVVSVTYPKTKINKQEKRKYISTAKDLLYPKEVIQDLTNAKTEVECIIILQRARNKTK